MPTGNYADTHTGLIAYVGNTAVAFARSFNSLETAPGPLGIGWTHTFNVRLELSRQPELIAVVGADGTGHVFARASDGALQPRDPSHAQESLRLQPDGSYLARLDDGTRYELDATGQLTALTIPGAGRLSIERGLQTDRVLDDQERPVFTLQHAPGTDRLLSVTAFPNLDLGPGEPATISFEYDAQGRLVAAIDPAGHRLGYEYADASSRFTRVVDALGDPVTELTYDARGRATSRTVRTGNVDTITYQQDSSGTLTSTETRVPSSFAPDWAPTFTHVLDPQSHRLDATFAAAPDEDPVVESWSLVNGRGVGQRTGGATPANGGIPITIRTASPGDPALVVGDPNDPLPSPACVAPPALHERPQDTEGWAAQTGRLDPTVALLRGTPLLAPGSQRISFDGFGRVTAMLDANLGRWGLTFDRTGQLVRVEAPPTELGATPAAAEFHRDAFGHVTEMIDFDGATSRFTYNDRDELVRIDRAIGTRVDYAYDQRGDLAAARLVAADGTEHLATYQHDGLQRLRLAVRDGLRVELAYAADGSCAAFGL